MALFIITWLCIAHCIYLVLAVKNTNTEPQDKKDLKEQYAMALLWPFAILFGILYIIYTGIVLANTGINWLFDNMRDLYYDIVIFLYLKYKIKK